MISRSSTLELTAGPLGCKPAFALQGRATIGVDGGQCGVHRSAAGVFVAHGTPLHRMSAVRRYAVSVLV